MRIAFSLAAIAFFLANVGSLRASFLFSTQESTVRLDEGARFLVNTPLWGIDGTFDKTLSATIVGHPLAFSDGVFRNAENETRLTATLDPLAGFVLAGGDTLRGEIDDVITSISISGASNRIEQSVALLNPVTFADAATSCTLALSMPLGASLSLNGGVLRLEADMRLKDGVALSGPGRVELTTHRLRFGSEALTLATPLLWDNAADIELSGTVSLASTWTFSGISTINGHGNILDLSAGGEISIAAGSTLYLTDVVLKGVDGTNVTFLGGVGGAPTLRLSHATIDLASSITTTFGGIFVEGESLVLIKNHIWNFTAEASLTVDRAVLWKENLAFTALDQGDITFDSEVANRALLSGGAIKRTLGSDVVTTGSALFSEQIEQNSSAVLAAAQDLESTTQFLGARVAANSYAALSLADLTGQSSNLVLTQKALVVQQSNAIVTLAERIRQNSNTIIVVTPSTDEEEASQIAAHTAIAAAAFASFNALVAFGLGVSAQAIAIADGTLGSIAGVAANVAVAASAAASVLSVATVGIAAAAAAAAGEANDHKNRANSAKNDTATAKSNAESARSTASSNKDLVVARRDDTESERNKAESAEQRAENAKSLLETADVSGQITSLQNDLDPTADQNTSAITALTALVNHNSNSVVSRTLFDQVQTDSNAVLTFEMFVEENSDTIVALGESALAARIAENSSATLTLRDRAAQNSNTQLTLAGILISADALVRDNSTTIAALTLLSEQNSNAALTAGKLVLETSQTAQSFNSRITTASVASFDAQTTARNAVLLASSVTAVVDGNDALRKHNSNQLVTLLTGDVIGQNSATALAGLNRVVGTSNQVVFDFQRAQHTSHSILAPQGLIEQSSFAVVALCGRLASTSAFLIYQITQTKDAVEAQITATFNDIESKIAGVTFAGFNVLVDQVFGTSSVIAGIHDRLVENSNVLVSNTELLATTSTQLVKTEADILIREEEVIGNLNRIFQNSNLIASVTRGLATTTQYLTNQLTVTLHELESFITDTFNTINTRIDAVTTTNFTVIVDRELHNSNALFTLQTDVTAAQSFQVQTSNAIVAFSEHLATTSAQFLSVITTTFNDINDRLESNSIFIKPFLELATHTSNLLVHRSGSIVTSSISLNAHITATRSALSTELTRTFNELDDKVFVTTSTGFVVLQDRVGQASSALVSVDETIFVANSNVLRTIETLVGHNSALIITGTRQTIVTDGLSETNSINLLHTSNAITTFTVQFEQDITATWDEFNTKIITATAGFEVLVARIDQHSNTLITLDGKQVQNSNALLTLAPDIEHNSSALVVLRGQLAHTSNQVLSSASDRIHTSNALITLADNITAVSQFLSGELTHTHDGFVASLTATFDNISAKTTALTPPGFAGLVNQIDQQSNSIVTLREKLAHNSNFALTSRPLIAQNSSAILARSGQVVALGESANLARILANEATTTAAITVGKADVNAAHIAANSDVIVTLVDSITPIATALSQRLEHNSSALVMLSKDIASVSLFLSTRIAQNSSAIVVFNEALQDVFFEGVTLSATFGTVILERKKGVDFTISPTLSVDITVSDGTSLLQGGSDIEFSTSDTLRVAGRDNIVDVTKTVSLRGGIQLDPDAELIFSFNDAASDPRLFIDSKVTLTVARGGRIECRGPGTVVVADGLEIHLSGTSDSSSLFELSRGVLMRIDTLISDTARLRVTGVGEYALTDGSALSIGENQRVVFGEATSDDLMVLIDDGSIVDIGRSGARLSFQRGAFTFEVHKEGILSVGSGAVVEFNALEGVASQGQVRVIALDDNGVLNLESGATLLLHDNAPGRGLINWLQDDGVVLGSGQVALLANTSLSGRIASRAFRHTGPATAQKIILELLQERSDLVATTLFTNALGQSVLRLQSGLVIALRDDDAISRDSASGFVYGTNGGRSFMITPDGVRIES